MRTFAEIERDAIMSTRADLDAMSNRANLEAALVEAEAELAVEAAVLTNGYAIPTETEAGLPDAFSKLAKARASCLAARTALARLNIAEGKPIAYRYERRRMAHQAASEKAHADRRKAKADRRRVRAARGNLNRAELIAKTDRLMTSAVNDPDSGVAASISNPDACSRSTQSSEFLVRAAGKSATRQSRARIGSRRPAGRFTAQEANTKHKRGLRPLAWQTVELSSLTLAYLLYYFIDVNLQIAMLPPSVGALLVG